MAIMRRAPLSLSRCLPPSLSLALLCAVSATVYPWKRTGRIMMQQGRETADRDREPRQRAETEGRDRGYSQRAGVRVTENNMYTLSPSAQRQYRSKRNVQATLMISPSKICTHTHRMRETERDRGRRRERESGRGRGYHYEEEERELELALLAR